MNNALRAAAVTLLLVSSAWAQLGGPTSSTSVVVVPPPNGVDDTTIIQSALDTCVARGPGCSVQLGKGTYHTRQLVAYNFRGSFAGAGKAKTTLEAIAYLPVTIPDVFVENLCTPNTSTCLWPSLIIFVDGDIHVSNLSIHVPAAPGTATVSWVLGGSPVIGLVDALRVMGRNRTNLSLDHVAIEGAPDSGGFSGFNLLNGLLYAGELPRSKTLFDDYFLAGTLTVRNCEFKSMVDGVGQDGFFRDSEVTIGGAPGAGNEFEDIVVGIWLESAQHSVFDVSFNTVSGSLNAMRVDEWLPVFVPARSSRYWVHDNVMTTSQPNIESLIFFNSPGNPWIRAAVYDNVFDSPLFVLDAIGAYYTRGAAIWGNRFRGSGLAAIGMAGSTRSTIAGNDLKSFRADSSLGYGQIYLDPDTHQELVLCARPTDEVRDQGSNNVVIGCRQLR